MKNLNSYIEKLDRGMADKLFFIDKLDLSSFDLIIDFGSANGEMISRFAAKVNNVPIIGIETSDEMREIAILKNKRNRNVSFVKEYSEIPFSNYSNILLILSSVLHEMNTSALKKYVFSLMKRAKTIVIRDMIAPSSDKKLNKKYVKRLYKQIPHYMKKDYINKWGKIKTLRSFYHLLLKYTYVDNWKTEVLEDYFNGGDILLEFYQKSNYKIKYYNLFNLPHQVKAVKELIGYEINEPTHCKYILERE